MTGLFCANFCHTRESFKPCHNAWCHECFIADPRLKFPISFSGSKDGFVLEEEKDRFMKGKKGDEFNLDFVAMQMGHSANEALRESVPNAKNTKET